MKTGESLHPALRLLICTVLAGLLIGTVGACRPEPVVIGEASAISIPSQQEWVDNGAIFSNGPYGSWDYQLGGGFAGAAIKKDGVYYLYYQGASGYRIADDTVTWRSVGVASSPDGINFAKSPLNPILTWFPHYNGEEGAVSTAAALDSTDEVVLYFGANTAVSSTRVNADGRLAVSLDAVNFSDQGVILDHADKSLWGSGDEIFPIVAIQDSGRWIVYYVPNGTLQSRRLGVAWGSARDQLTNSAAATSGGSPITAWGMAGAAQVAPGIYALFLTTPNAGEIEVRTVAVENPERLSSPVETYRFRDLDKATVLLDNETRTWFMYYRTAEGYGVRLAPAGEPDLSLPTVPESLAARPTGHDRASLTWDPANDPETGIVAYRIFRSDAHIATVKGWSFEDAGLAEQSPYAYQVSAVNLHGIEGPRSPVVQVTTLADTSPPQVIAVNASGAPNRVLVQFDEPVERSSAESILHYTIEPAVSILGAILKPGQRTLALTTSPHQDGIYEITFGGIQDRARSPNTLAPGAVVRYIHLPVGGLLGAWNLDQGSGNTAWDTSNHGNDGSLLYASTPGPQWIAGIHGNALEFDGVDDQVTIPGDGPLQAVTAASHSFAAWVRPKTEPPNTNANNRAFSLLVRDYTGLYYDHGQRYRATVRLSDGAEIAVRSAPAPPGSWHHLVMVVDDSRKLLRLYLDGQEVRASPVSYAGELADLGDAPYYMGTSEPLRERYEFRLLGQIDEVRIFDRALSAGEVQALFQWDPSG